MEQNPQTILLVEDNEDDIFLMQRALSSARLDIPVQVAIGNYDIGICTSDWLQELLPAPFFAPAALGFSFADLAVWAGTLADQLLHVPLAGDVAGMAMLLFLLVEFPNQRRFAKVLFFGTGLFLLVYAGRWILNRRRAVTVDHRR